MRISKAIAVLAPLALALACSSGGPGSPTIEGPPGGFGSGGGAGSPVLTPGGGGLGGGGQGQDAGGDKDTGSPGFDSGTVKFDSGGTGTDTATPMFDNYDACVGFFDKVNSLPCISSPLPTTGCTHSKVSCDLTSYYDCLGSAYVCTDSGTLDTSGASSCKATCGGA